MLVMCGGLILLLCSGSQSHTVTSPDLAYGVVGVRGDAWNVGN